MTAPVYERYTVAFQGFSEFERGALSSSFRLAAQRTPAYEQVEHLDMSDFVIADADQADALRAVVDTGRSRDTVFVGTHAPKGSVAWLPRPIDPVRIVRELDALVERRRLARAQYLAGISPAGIAQTGVEPDGSGLELSGDPSSFGAFDTDEAVTNGPDVLVAEDSAIARRFMEVKLQQLGYRVHLAADGEEAMALLGKQRFKLAFLDIVLGPPTGIDGLRICQHIKHDAEFATQGPKVIIVTGLTGATDRVRGSLAGCDAYLTKPVMEEELLHTLRTLDPDFAARDPASTLPRREKKRKARGTP